MLLKNISIEKKILSGYLFSLILFIVLGSFLFISKDLLYRQSLKIKRNNEVELTLNKLIPDINKLQAEKNRQFIENQPVDNLKYRMYIKNLVIGLNELTKQLERNNNHKYLNPLKSILNELSALSDNPLPAVNNSDMLKKDMIYFDRVNSLLNTIYSECESENIQEFSGIQEKVDKSFLYFFLLAGSSFLIVTLYFIALLHDSKVRKNLYLKLEQSRNELETTINTVPALIFEKNKEQKFTKVNKYLLDYFGITEEQILNKTVAEAMSDHKYLLNNEQWLIYEEDDAVINNKIRINDIEREFHLSDGKKCWLNVNMAPIVTREGEVTGLIGVMNDITQKIYFQNSLLKAIEELKEHNRQKTRFFSIIAHDLRSPFSGLIGISEFLLSDFDELTEEEKRELLVNMNNAIHSVWALLDNLLAWSRIQFEKISFSPEYFCLKPLIEKTFISYSISAGNKQIELKNSCPQDLKVYADKNMLETILRNLINNAIKYTNPGGCVEVWAEESKSGAQISVIDNGIGMDKRAAEKLFIMEVKESKKGTAAEKGTGLGLIICEEFIRKHKSSFSVESELNKGTRISFMLPAIEPEC